MPRLKKNVAPLLERAIESLTLSIELFNRPAEIGRSHGVLILLQHSFEMLLKSMILQSTGSIHGKGEKYTYGFDKCLSVASEQLKLTTSDERATLSILDAQRDQAAHYYINISEDVLYVHAQSGVTLFDTLLRKSFSKQLADFLPSRVLPVSTRPPRDLSVLLNSELAEVDRLLAKGRRQGAQAAENFVLSWRLLRAYCPKMVAASLNPKLTQPLPSAESDKTGKSSFPKLRN